MESATCSSSCRTIAPGLLFEPPGHAVFDLVLREHAVEQLTDFLFGSAHNTAILACFQGLSNGEEGGPKRRT